MARFLDTEDGRLVSLVDPPEDSASRTSALLDNGCGLAKQFSATQHQLRNQKQKARIISPLESTILSSHRESEITWGQNKPYAISTSSSSQVASQCLTPGRRRTAGENSQGLCMSQGLHHWRHFGAQKQETSAPKGAMLSIPMGFLMRQSSSRRQARPTWG